MKCSNSLPRETSPNHYLAETCLTTFSCAAGEYNCPPWPETHLGLSSTSVVVKLGTNSLGIALTIKKLRCVTFTCMGLQRNVEIVSRCKISQATEIDNGGGDNIHIFVFCIINLRYMSTSYPDEVGGM